METQSKEAGTCEYCHKRRGTYCVVRDGLLLKKSYGPYHLVCW